MNIKKTLTLLTIVSSTGAIAFFGYKAYKQAKFIKENTINEEEVDAILEAKRMVKEEEEKQKSRVDTFDNPEEDGYNDEVPSRVQEHLDADIYNDSIEEETETLRHNPDSEDALVQFQEMRLVGFSRLGESRKILWDLFKHPYYPESSEDETLAESLLDERRRFFKEGRYIHTVSFAEVFLHFADKSNFDMDYDVEDIVTNMLDNCGLTLGVGEVTKEQILARIQGHVLNTEIGYGIFALDAEEFKELMASLRGSRISFNKQYQVYLTTELSRLEEDTDGE